MSQIQTLNFFDNMIIISARWFFQIIYVYFSTRDKSFFISLHFQRFEINYAITICMKSQKAKHFTQIISLQRALCSEFIYSGTTLKLVLHPFFPLNYDVIFMSFYVTYHFQSVFVVNYFDICFYDFLFVYSKVVYQKWTSVYPNFIVFFWFFFIFISVRPYTEDNFYLVSEQIISLCSYLVALEIIILFDNNNNRCESCVYVIFAGWLSTTR